MPVGIRIICKLLKMNALKRVDFFFFMAKNIKKTIFFSLKKPNSTKTQINSLIGNFLFDKWIIPNFLHPVFSGYYHDFTERNLNNSLIIAEVF